MVIIMKLVALLLLLAVLVLPAGAASVNSWTEIDIPGHNLTLNYTSSFNVSRNDTLGITIRNIGNGSLNDTITVNEINVSDTSKAKGNWTGALTIAPNSSKTVNFPLNVTTSAAATVDIKIHYNVSSDNRTLNVTAHYPGTPAIISWFNNRTGDNSLTLTINEGETVRFSVTADQAIAEWLWTLNRHNLNNPSNALNYTFDDDGFYKIAVNGSNNNGTTQPVVWNVNVLEKEHRGRITILSWHPQLVDYVYVNDTVSETVTYSVTTAEPVMTWNWTVDGVPAAGSAEGSTYSYTHTWDNRSVGFHTVIFKGNNTDSRVELRWYVDVYETGKYSGRNIFEIIEDALDNQFIDIRIRMYRYHIAQHEGNAEIVAEKVNLLHDAIAKRQMTREALRLEFMAGNITVDEYVAALKQVQRDAKYDMKFAKQMAKIAKEDLKDEMLEKKLDEISEIDEDEKEIKKDKGDKYKGNKGKKHKGRDKKTDDELNEEEEEDED